MEELVPMFDQEFDGESFRAVDARDLWKALKVKTEFSHWISRRIKEAQLIEKLDFVFFVKSDEKSRGRPCQEYRLTVDAAKHLAIVWKSIPQKPQIVKL